MLKVKKNKRILVIKLNIMTYKDLNVYKRTYNVAIKLHQFLDDDKNAERLSTDEIKELKQASKKIFAYIAEAFSQRSAKAKRFLHFKALEIIHALIMDLDFLHDIQRFSDDAYHEFYKEYDISARQLYKYNQSILEKVKEKEEKQIS